MKDEHTYVKKMAENGGNVVIYQYLSFPIGFVKDTHVVGKKLPGMVVTWPFISCYLLGVCRTWLWPQATSEAITFDPGPIKI